MFQKKSTATAMANAPDDKRFWVSDGKVLRNVNDLYGALKAMSDGTFRHHVNKEKNDFAKWLREVLKESRLARQIKRVKTREATIKWVAGRLRK